MITVKSGYTKKSQKGNGGVKDEIALLLRPFFLVFTQGDTGCDPCLAGPFMAP
jgi:hypothetical protein